jgi:hypothetical protein
LNNRHAITGGRAVASALDSEHRGCQNEEHGKQPC